MPSDKKAEPIHSERIGLDNLLAQRALDLPTKESAPSYGFGSARRKNGKLYLTKEYAMNGVGENSPGLESTRLFVPPPLYEQASRL